MLESSLKCRFRTLPNLQSYLRLVVCIRLQFILYSVVFFLHLLEQIWTDCGIQGKDCYPRPQCVWSGTWILSVRPLPLSFSSIPVVLRVHAKWQSVSILVEIEGQDEVLGLHGPSNGGFSEAHFRPRVMRTLLFQCMVFLLSFFIDHYCLLMSR